MSNARNLANLLNTDTTIATADVANGGITTAKLADDAVTSAKLDTNIAIGGTLGVTGAITGGSLVVDDITIDGSTISDAGDFTLDIGGDITLDADGQQIFLKNNNVHWGTLLTNGTPQHFYIDSKISDGDIIFRGNDGGSNITALTLDMSEGGRALFTNDVLLTTDNKSVKVGAGNDLSLTSDGTNGTIASPNGNLTVDVAGTIILDGDYAGETIHLKDGGTHFGSIVRNNSDLEIRVVAQDEDIVFVGNDGGSTRTALTLDMSDEGTAIFNNRIRGTEGSLSAPMYSFTNDTNTGMFSPSADKIGFVGAGVQVMQVTNVNVGITSTDQTARLNIESNTSQYTPLNIKNNNSGAGGYFIAFINSSGSLAGGVTHTGSTTVQFVDTSDYRLKENVSYNFDATTRLKQLKPCRFNFIADGTDITQDGFLAHEVSHDADGNPLVPIAIVGDKDETQDIGTVKDADGSIVDSDITELQFTLRKQEAVYSSDATWTKTSTENVYQQIDQSKLVPLLVKTIQELEARITVLETA